MRSARIGCTAVLLVSLALAQSNSKKGAVVSGTIVDGTGAVIPGAKVTLKGHGIRDTLTDGEVTSHSLGCEEAGIPYAFRSKASRRLIAKESKSLRKKLPHSEFF
jgi:hypothetical protein